MSCCAGILPVCLKAPLSKPFQAHHSPLSNGSCSSYDCSLGKSGKSTSDFQGRWICKATWGLEEFLLACGVGYFQRKFAVNAAWPVWEFMQEDNKSVFINKGVVGEIREEFCPDGEEYTTLNGWQQSMTCKAFWEDDTLVIVRSSPHGPFREERLVDENGVLHFTLRGLEPPIENESWGRKFERDGDPVMEAQLIAQGFDADDVRRVVAEAPSSMEEATRILAIEAQLIAMGFDADDVRKVAAEAPPSVEAASNILLERSEAPAPGFSIWNMFNMFTSDGSAADADRASASAPPFACAPAHALIAARMARAPSANSASGRARTALYRIVQPQAVVSSTADMQDAVDHLEEGAVVYVVLVHTVDASWNVLGQMADQRWIRITAEGVPVAELVSLVQQLVELGFSEIQAEKAAEQHSTLDAAVTFLAGGGQAPIIGSVTDASSSGCRPGMYQIVREQAAVSSSSAMADAVHYLEKGEVVDIVAIATYEGEDHGAILGEMADHRWITITTAGGSPIAKRLSLEQELLELGFSKYQAQEAVKRTSSVEAAVAFLADADPS